MVTKGCVVQQKTPLETIYGRKFSKNKVNTRYLMVKAAAVIITLISLVGLQLHYDYATKIHNLLLIQKPN